MMSILNKKQQHEFNVNFNKKEQLFFEIYVMNQIKMIKLKISVYCYNYFKIVLK